VQDDGLTGDVVEARIFRGHPPDPWGSLDDVAVSAFRARASSVAAADEPRGGVDSTYLSRIRGGMSTTSKRSSGRSPIEPTSSPQLDKLVAADQVRQLFAKSAAPYLGPPVDAILYSTVVWRMVPHVRLWIWMGAMLAVMVQRIVVRQLYHRARPGVDETPRWGHASMLLSGLNGVLWGAAVFWIWVPHSLSVQLLYLFLCGTLAVGATNVSVSHLPSYFAFTISAGLPLAIRFFMHPDWIHQIVGICTLMYLVTMGSMAVSAHRTAREASRLRIRFGLWNETLEARVIERTAELQAALGARDEFILVASHELKTPASSLRLQLQIVERELHKAGVRTRAQLGGRLDFIFRQLARLSTLVNTLLDVSSMTDGRVRIEPREMDLGQVVRHVVSAMEEDARLKGSTLTLELDDPIVGCWDPVRLEQLLSNLISNAAKFGAGEPVVVRARRDGDAAVVTVEDRGIGISPDDLARIFGKYERATLARSYGGLGLGLFVVQRLVEAMGGTIDVWSRPGEGARFTVRLPQASAAASEAALSP
jgi:signal transduction histidine kinase